MTWKFPASRFTQATDVQEEKKEEVEEKKKKRKHGGVTSPLIPAGPCVVEFIVLSQACPVAAHTFTWIVPSLALQASPQEAHLRLRVYQEDDWFLTYIR
jgi:hypothetical protein